MSALLPTQMTNPFRAPTAQEWIAQNAPAPPVGAIPPLPLPIPVPTLTGAPSASGASSLAFEQLFGPHAEDLLGEVVDNPEFHPEHQALALAVLAGEKPLKQLALEDRNLLDEIAHQLAGVTPKGHRPAPPKARSVPFDEETSFTMGPEEDWDPDMAYAPSDSDRRG